MLIAAHPDDETLGLGAQLAAIPSLRLIHASDGAPRDPRAAHRAGFDTREAYARARAAELDAALATLGVAGARRRSFGLVDQEVVLGMVGLIEALAPELGDCDAVVTHPYEGGHPDHDACALAAQYACELLERRGRRAPQRLEFPSYHERDGAMACGLFWPDVDHAEQSLPLEERALAAKCAALACFRSQAPVIAAFPPDPERLRTAPRYDFSRAPPPGHVLYERFGWRIDGAAWREQARRARARLGIAPT